MRYLDVILSHRLEEMEHYAEKAWLQQSCRVKNFARHNDPRFEASLLWRVKEGLLIIAMS